MRRPPAPTLATALVMLLVAPGWPALARQGAQRSVIQTENVRMDYAQVMRVRPVYQTLHATRMEQRCQTPAGTVVVAPQDSEPGRFERFVEAVRGVLGSDPEPETLTTVPDDAEHCEMVEVEREFRRPIAYDVDYVYKGAKYRSRLPLDPGNHVRVRVSVTPVVLPATGQ
jgi:uncharacterized protein YcfJ